MSDRALQRKIHVGCKQLGLDEDTRHDLQFAVTGKASMSDMTEADLRLVISALKERGFQTRIGTRRPAAKRRDVRYCHVLWRLLVEHGQARVKGAKGLNAFIRSRFEGKWGHVPIDIDAMSEADEISDVVEALKEWCQRSGIPTRP